MMNQDSSRSHSIFTITVETSSMSDMDCNNGSQIRVGKLNLVDLAGSERLSKSGATGERFIEMTKINWSLSALGNVISALVDGKSSHIPYRDSKLTRLLQDSLGGNTRTVMVANIGPAESNYDETINTLRYASRAKHIKNKPHINEDPKDAMIREFQEEIMRLKSQLQENNPDIVSTKQLHQGSGPPLWQTKDYRHQDPKFEEFQNHTMSEEAMACLKADLESGLEDPLADLIAPSMAVGGGFELLAPGISSCGRPYPCATPLSPAPPVPPLSLAPSPVSRPTPHETLNLPRAPACSPVRLELEHLKAEKERSEEEKERVVSQLHQRLKEMELQNQVLARGKDDRGLLESKLKALEEKLLCGSNTDKALLLAKSRQQERELAHFQQQLQERRNLDGERQRKITELEGLAQGKKKEWYNMLIFENVQEDIEELLGKKHTIPEAQLLAEEKCSSMEEELDLKTRKLRKLVSRYQLSKQEVASLRTELQDTLHEFHLERTDLLWSLRSLEQQDQLKSLIIEVSIFQLLFCYNRLAPIILQISIRLFPTHNEMFHAVIPY
eukprot:Gb_08362 [translate_table: standard]